MEYSYFPVYQRWYAGWPSPTATKSPLQDAYFTSSIDIWASIHALLPSILANSANTSIRNAIDSMRTNNSTTNIFVNGELKSSNLNSYTGDFAFFSNSSLCSVVNRVGFHHGQNVYEFKGNIDELMLDYLMKHYPLVRTMIYGSGFVLVNRYSM